MSNKYLFNAEAVLPNGEIVRGPITTEDDSNFLFRNQISSLDFYLLVKKSDNGNWYQAGGPEIKYPQYMVDELGNQIDIFFENNPI